MDEQDKRYMDENYVVTLGIHESLLEIINEGINRIILQIKKKLGKDINTTDQNANAIMSKLNELKSSIEISILDLQNENPEHIKLKEKNDDPTLLNTEIGNKYVKDFNGLKFNGSTFEGNTFEDFKNKKTGYLAEARKKLTDLDSNTEINLQDIPNDSLDANGKPTGKTNSAHEIQTRLNNCHILEMLYLIKHEEIMKTFAFTLNLFDKYKYSVKLLLFVLKHLVKKKQIKIEDEKHAAKESCVDVKLPKTLIPNIQTLLADQEKVQEVITRMKEQLETNPLGGVNENGSQVLNPAGGPDENVLDKSLSNLTTQ
jgi:hypothetical protein